MTDTPRSTHAAFPPATADDARKRGLTDDEFLLIVQKLGRTPNHPELGMFSAMWNEHCSYKSSRIHLKRLPTTGARVIHGPGENAGVIDLGQGLALAFKMESHNHPSFIEPYQGAATGVGGILRDVFTMGARPIACLNALRFGEPTHPKTRALVRGTVAGIGGYGNSFGVPTVGGEVNFHKSYNGNILVNAMAAGLLAVDRVFTAKPTRTGGAVFYVGSPTGREGIHGASMASDAFASDEAEDKRPTVQVGDPFTGRRLLEASLALMEAGAVAAVQDMGAAGLTCSAAELAYSGGLGITLDLDAVPVRAAGMSAEEMLLSETQERMLFVLNDGCEATAMQVLQRFGLAAAVVGRLDDDGLIKVHHAGRLAVCLPADVLVNGAPMYERPMTPPVPAAPLPAVPQDPVGMIPGLLRLAGSFDGCSRRPIFDQYDSLVRGNTLRGPGGDAALVRIDALSRAVAFTCDVTPRYCAADPYTGAAQAVCEAYRNLSACGALPLAVTDNLNFGNVRDPAVMGAFSASVDGIGDACRALDLPVVSGNVSLYNATDGVSIMPTPAIGAVGLLDDVSRSADIAFKADDAVLLLIGQVGVGHLGCSLWLREIAKSEAGNAPAVDFAAERAAGQAIRALIAAGLTRTVHDCSDGGLLFAIAESALAGNIGVRVTLPELAHIPPHAVAFGEDQGRYICAVQHSDLEAVRTMLGEVPVFEVGSIGGDMLQVVGHGAVSLAQLRHTHEETLSVFWRTAAA